MDRSLSPEALAAQAGSRCCRKDHVLVAPERFGKVLKWLAQFAVAWGRAIEFVDTTAPVAGRPLGALAAGACPGSRPAPTRPGRPPIRALHCRDGPQSSPAGNHRSGQARLL
jgi:hypothetical protein